MGCPNESDLTESIGRRAAAAVVDTRDHKSLLYFCVQLTSATTACQVSSSSCDRSNFDRAFTAAADRVTFLPLSRLIAIIGGGRARQGSFP